MKKSTSLLLIVTTMIVALLVVIGCSSDQADTTGTGKANSQEIEQTLPENTDKPGNDKDLPDAEIDIANFAYSPNEITIRSGTTVTWRNTDSVIHTVTSDDGIFDSGGLPGGATFSFTFKQPGVYQYYCIPHPYMKATIIVE